MKSHEQVLKAVAESIEEFQKSEEMTLVGLGEITGLSLYTVRNWKKQRCLPDLYSAYLLADAMGMTLDELITRKK